MDFIKCSATERSFEALSEAPRVPGEPRVLRRAHRALSSLRELTARALSSLLAALALAVMLASCGTSATPRSVAKTTSLAGFDGAALPAGGPVYNFTLTDQFGERVSLSSYRGRVTLLTFLYPTCGATCVLIAQQIRGALNELAHPVPVLIVSADPAADSPASVRSFLAEVSLSGRALYLSGSLAQLQPIWREFRVKPASAGATAFADYAGVLLLDRSGSERVLFESEELSPEALTHDILKLEQE